MLEITYLPNAVRCFIVDIICIPILVDLFSSIFACNFKLSSSISTDLTNLNEDQFTELFLSQAKNLQRHLYTLLFQKMFDRDCNRRYTPAHRVD